MSRADSNTPAAAKTGTTPSAATNIAALLKQHPVFATAEDGVLRRVAAFCTIVDLEPGAPVFTAGAPARAVYLIATGAVRVFQRSADGPALTVAHLVPASLGGWFEILSASPDEPARYVESAEALKPSTLVEIPAPAFLTMLDESPTTCRAMLRESSSQLASRAQRELDVLLDVPARLARLLLAYAEIAGTETPDGILIRQPLTHELLANGIGVAVKSIARTLKSWTAVGMVGRHKGWVLLRDAAALRQACNSSSAALVTRAAGAHTQALS